MVDGVRVMQRCRDAGILLIETGILMHLHHVRRGESLMTSNVRHPVSAHDFLCHSALFFGSLLFKRYGVVPTVMWCSLAAEPCNL
jgi:hypothetical protein